MTQKQQFEALLTSYGVWVQAFDPDGNLSHVDIAG